MITLRYRSPLRELTGREVEEIQAVSVGDVLRYIRRVYGRAAYKQARQMLITVDGTSIVLLDDMRTQLRDGAVVGFLPVCGGG